MSRTPVRRPGDIEQASTYDALGRSERVNPALANELRSHSMATLVEARKHRGSDDGLMGPRAFMLSGFEEVADGGEGVFLWDSVSSIADDEGVTTIEVTGVAVGRWVRAQLYPTQYGQLLRAPQVLTSGTTFAPLIPGRPALVEVNGSGGGSGGVVNSGAGQITFATGGGSGAYARRYYGTLPASCTIAIGGGGAAGANTGTDGGAGGSTTFSDGTTTVTSPGGGGGFGSTATGASAATLAVHPGGPGAAVATNGNINGVGQTAPPAVRVSGTVGQGGPGAASHFSGGAPGRTTQGAGTAGILGGGASGALSINAGGAAAGAVGGPGFIVVWEF